MLAERLQRYRERKLFKEAENFSETLWTFLEKPYLSIAFLNA